MFHANNFKLITPRKLVLIFHIINRGFLKSLNYPYPTCIMSPEKPKKSVQMTQNSYTWMFPAWKDFPWCYLHHQNCEVWNRESSLPRRKLIIAPSVLGPIVAHHIPNLNDLRWIGQTQGATHKPRVVSVLKTLRCLIPPKRVIYPTMGNSKGKSTCHSKGKPVEKWSNEGIFHTTTFHSWPQLGDWRCIPTVKFFLRKKNTDDTRVQTWRTKNLHPQFKMAIYIYIS